MHMREGDFLDADGEPQFFFEGEVEAVVAEELGVGEGGEAGADLWFEDLGLFDEHGAFGLVVVVVVFGYDGFAFVEEEAAVGGAY